MGLEKALNTEYNLIILDESGREIEYKIADGARFYVGDKKVRFSVFKKSVKPNLTSVEFLFDTDGYITRMEATIIE